jgi:hypothetical protein
VTVHGDEVGKAAECDQEAPITDIGPIAKERVEAEVLTRAAALPSPPDILSLLQERACCGRTRRWWPSCCVW